MSWDAGDIVTADDLADEIGQGTLTSNSANITTTETVVISTSTTLVAGRRYAVELHAKIGASVAAQSVILWVRAGSTISGTELANGQAYVHTTSSVGFGPSVLRGEHTAVSSGSQSFVGSIQRNGGSGNVFIVASATAPARLIVTEIKD